MGLFNSIAGSVLGKLGGEQGGAAQIAMDLFNQHGGLAGVLEKFKDNGLAEQTASWIGKGDNSPVSAAQIVSVLGDGQIAQMAAKFGITPEVLIGLIAEHLPNVIDRLTPDGEVPADSNNLLGSILTMLK